MQQFTCPEPFRYNPWKHHLSWIFTNIAKEENSTEIKELTETINSLNSNYIDLYTGDFKPEEMVAEIEYILRERRILEKESFIRWIQSQEYGTVRLKDNSVWILRKGNSAVNYIHIHPGRYTPLSLRIHGNSFKTALILKLIYPNETYSLPVINETRKRFLSLPPVKNLENSFRVLEAIELVNHGIKSQYQKP